jgi:hypothetical protein
MQFATGKNPVLRPASALFSRVACDPRPTASDTPGHGSQANRLNNAPSDVAWRLTIAERKRILLDHIHGVDLDSQAVEVTKLNLLLKCLEGETSQTLGFEQRLFRERALPDLGKNILCGNSLIGTDIIGTEAWNAMSEEERRRVNPFDCERAFSGVFKGGGFDAVIGNPPYGYMLTEAQQIYFRTHYKHQDNQLDYYQLFLERCLSRDLRSPGLLGMIIPNPWLTNVTQKSLRRFVIQTTALKQVVHFDFAVFPTVTVDTEVVMFEKPLRPGNTVQARFVASVAELRDGTYREIQHTQDKWSNSDGAVINLSVNAESESLVARVRERAPLRVGDVAALNVGIKPYQTGKGTPVQSAKTVKERPFDSARKVDGTFRLLLRGRDITRYHIAPTEERYLSYGPWLAEPRPAAKFDAPEKIFMRQTGDSLIAAIDDEQRLGMNNLHVIVPREGAWSAKRLIAFLNSRMLNWFYQTINPEKGEALAEVKRSHIALLPIPHPPDNGVRLDRLVDSMLSLHKRLSAEPLPQRQEQLQREIDATDRQIDQLVYELYGLTEEEIKIVEEATR